MKVILTTFCDVPAVEHVFYVTVAPLHETLNLWMAVRNQNRHYASVCT